MTLAGMVTLTNDLQLEKELSPSETSTPFFGSCKSFSAIQLEKAELPIVSSLLGSVTLSSTYPDMCAVVNAEFPIDVSMLFSTSKATVFSELQS